ncbi:hypothetical protein GDO86_008725 [Hymenochirus boettgeri]|uniref:U5 small nuclear ribonucleoprotein TSSC4 n=1 Tax=Hymenochirus boettgeri TaxID=247094 RepID=A0A8T2J655_9PIPI|nr:hypothetical protein GDO86_008725 [Hymenochirus boettgeri]
MSVSEGGDMPNEANSSLVSKTCPESCNLTLSDSDPELPDEAEVASISFGEEEEDEDDIRQDGNLMSPVTPFSLKGTDANFSQRSLSIFGDLKEVQRIGGKNLHNPTSTETLGFPSSPDRDSVTNIPKFSLLSENKVSSKSQPVSSLDKKVASLPDYMSHPERWTKYSLEDVPDTSDYTNRSTALNFMAELQQQRDDKKVFDVSSCSYNQDATSCGKSRILFTKPNKASWEGSEKVETSQNLKKKSETWEDEVEEESKDPGDDKDNRTVGFHGVKKRSRKNIRAKADSSGEENSS